MGELVAGQPALLIETAVSLPLDFVSVLSLLHRATAESGLDPWLIEARERLPIHVRENLDLLHGFSGRLLFYPEEPALRFQPLLADRRNASFEDFMAYLHRTPAEAYLDMLEHALKRVHMDIERRWKPPIDAESWRLAIAPAITSASTDQAMGLVTNPGELKRRTIDLFQGVWDSFYKDAREVELPLLQEAARRGQLFGDRGFPQAYASLTGQRLPAVLDQPPPSITRVVFCPSAHLGRFVSYIAYEPDLIVYFAAPQLIERCTVDLPDSPTAALNLSQFDTDQPELLEAARALSDPTRLRIIDLLLEGELYAQEIVGRLGVAQSAASRHLAQLERAGMLTVEARRGSKFYAVNHVRLDSVAAALTNRSTRAKSLSHADRPLDYLPARSS